MIFKSAAAKTLDQASAVLHEVKSAYQPQIDAGTLTDIDRERIRRRLQVASDLEGRSYSENTFSLLGEYVATLKRLFRTGRWGMAREEYKQELQELVRRQRPILRNFRNRASKRKGLDTGAVTASHAAVAPGADTAGVLWQHLALSRRRSQERASVLLNSPMLLQHLVLLGASQLRGGCSAAISPIS